MGEHMIKAINHVGVSVSNLDRSIGFYRDVLGMEFLRQRVFAGETYEKILGLKGATGRLAIMEAGSMRLELFEFSNPSPKPSEANRSVCDHGITHFCIEVGDAEEEYQRLKAAGVPFHCEPLDFSGLVKATYGRDPDGNVFELLERYATPGA
jgi:catechol 2,3-dioxygenase-like lactoylglutathione lyase family enzyme